MHTYNIKCESCDMVLYQASFEKELTEQEQSTRLKQGMCSACADKLRPSTKIPTKKETLIKELQASDYDMVRVIEDIIVLLGDSASSLPQEVKDKIAKRVSLRQQLTELEGA